MIYLRMYLQSAYMEGFKDHPMEVMKQLGISWIRAYPETMCDAWFFEALEDQSIPTWINVIDKPWYFTDPNVEPHLIKNSQIVIE